MCKCGTGRLINFGKSTNKLGIQGQLVLPPLQNVYRFDFLIRFIVFTMYLGSCWFLSIDSRTRKPRRKSCMYGVLNEVYLQTSLWMDVTFRDEFNGGN